MGIARLKELHQAVHPTAGLRRPGSTGRDGAGADLTAQDLADSLEAEAEEEDAEG